MLLNQSSLEAIHRFCTSNRPLLEQSSSAGCVCCGASFAPAEIHDWVPARDPLTREFDGAPGAHGAGGESAACPRCGHDAVLPSAAPIVLSPRMLAAVQAYWFGAEHPTTRA